MVEEMMAAVVAGVVETAVLDSVDISSKGVKVSKVLVSVLGPDPFKSKLYLVLRLLVLGLTRRNTRAN